MIIASVGIWISSDGVVEISIIKIPSINKTPMSQQLNEIARTNNRVDLVTK